MFRFDNKEIEDAIEFINEHQHVYYEPLINCIKNNDIREITEEEKEKANSFYKEHKDCCSKKTGKMLFSSTCGGFEYILDWTPVGFCYTYKCNTCDESIDVTDYSILAKYYEEHKDEFGSNEYDILLTIKPFSFIICETDFGPCITIIDNYTHDSKDITDSDSW